MLGSISRREKIRSRSSVRTDLCKLGLKASLFRQMGAKYALRRYSEVDYRTALGIITLAQSYGLEFTQIQVLSAKTMELQSFLPVSEEKIRPCVENGALKISKLTGEKNPRQVLELVDILGLARERFAGVMACPDSKLEDIAQILTEIIRLIKIKNVSVYIPTESENWARIFCSSPWPADGSTKYVLPEGHAPSTTLASIFRSPKRFFQVDISIRSGETEEAAKRRIEAGFREAGLEPDWASIQNDREKAHGDGTMLFFKIVSHGGNPLAVFQTHNLVSRKEKADPLFQKLEDASRIIGLLDGIFEQAAVAIKKIGEGNILKTTTSNKRPSSDLTHKLQDTGISFNDERFLSPRESRYLKYKKFGQIVSMEIIDETMKKCHHVLGSLFSFISDVGREAWGEFPETFVRERLVKVSKIFCFRINGKNAAFLAIKNFEVTGRIIRFIELAITKKTYQKWGIITKAHYHLFKEAYMEEVAKFIASKGRFKIINYLKSLPSLVRAALYVMGYCKKPPDDMSRVKVAVALFAVHPVSLGSYLDYIGPSDVFPNPYQPSKEPIAEQIEIAKKVVPKNCKFDEKTFILEGDYGGIEHLIPDPDKPPEDGGVMDYKDPVVNQFMRERLKYEEKKGRDQVVVMSFDLRLFRKYFEKQRNEKKRKDITKSILNWARRL